MRALLFPGDRRTELVDISAPEPGPGQVRIAVGAAGLCGSDLHMAYHLTPEERSREILGTGIVADPGRVPGHEGAGTVQALGAGVTNVGVGDRVGVLHISGCGHCSICRRGYDINCARRQVYGYDRPGFLGEYMVAEAKDCVRLPDRVNFAEGAYYTCGAGTGYQTVLRTDVSGRDTVAVVGLGPVGLAACLFARLSGASVIGIDPVAERRELALRHGGAHQVVNPETENVVDAVADASHQRGADVTIEASGSPAGRNTALDVAGLWARCVFVGFGPETQLDVNGQVIQKQLDVRGSWAFSMPVFQDVFRYAAENDVDLTPLITHHYSLDDGDRALREFDQGSSGKSILTPAASGAPDDPSR